MRTGLATDICSYLPKAHPVKEELPRPSGLTLSGPSALIMGLLQRFHLFLSFQKMFNIERNMNKIKKLYCPL